MTAPERVSADDLDAAATWLEAYDDDHEDADGRAEAGDRMRRVAARLRADARARREEAEVRAVIRRAGGDPDNARQRARAREVLAEHRARQAVPPA